MSFYNLSAKAYLLLQDGTVFEGVAFGAKGSAMGEVVFNTSMTGYQQLLTDPTNMGQLVVQTFPSIGDVGVNSTDDESDIVAVSGYIVREWCAKPSNFRCEGDLNAYMEKRGIVGIHSIDTRALTRILRDRGVMNGIITTENVYEQKDALIRQLCSLKNESSPCKVSTKEIREFKAENAKHTVAVYDFGCRKYLIDRLLERGCDVKLLPALTSAQELRELAPDGILLSNGPENPDASVEIVSNLAEIAKLGIPMFGVCLGHQLLALSQGGTIEKHKYGHHGGQPVLDLELGRTFVTAQNHCYAISSIPENAGKITHINANDKTCEGIRYSGINAFSVQFLPEVHSDPLDHSYLLDAFVEMMERNDA